MLANLKQTPRVQDERTRGCRSVQVDQLGPFCVERPLSFRGRAGNHGCDHPHLRFQFLHLGFRIVIVTTLPTAPDNSTANAHSTLCCCISFRCSSVHQGFGNDSPDPHCWIFADSRHTKRLSFITVLNRSQIYEDVEMGGGHLDSWAPQTKGRE